MTHPYQHIITELYRIKALEFGTFKLRSGLESPFYLDLRKVVTYPALLRDICTALWNKINEKNIKYDVICGVPYAALAFSAGLSVLHGVPGLTKRKERKQHGTSKLVEGVFLPGQTCLVVEDVVTSGISLLETIAELETEGLNITDALVIIDREQGGAEALAQQDCRVFALFSITEMLDVLHDIGLLPAALYNKCYDFIRMNPGPNTDHHAATSGKHTDHVAAPQIITETHPPRLSYEELLPYAKHPAAKKLLETTHYKQTNLICAADVADPNDLINLANTVGPYICALKTHIDALTKVTPQLIEALKELAERHEFLLFEDRKFGDIGSTLLMQYTAPVFNVHQWADLITVHPIGGASSVKAMMGAGKAAQILIAQMSTEDTLTDAAYLQKAVAIAQQYPEAIAGVVAQQRVHQNPGILQFVPGIHLVATQDDKGQTYNSPEVAFAKRGADFIIVGRGIYQHQSPDYEAARYQNAGWEAYEALLD
ncbi:MAG: orotidine-5'-phosphate decarboxylase [Sphingobacteriales bacterium]|jgi:uridine monophosphate synthetase|nr:orotidine-5'-phosphate decarboxylase [Sphingobacteriales bacterium]MBP9142769.1 orotidine-5'-phosphate decarboxylase [Chitinophagales bacterium]MDA0199869.1 orotidine-5'-phosphate decarboxylase [Bacteroidota bacterium]MBK7526599.1 orotidine-5'-phosphate decarboxylase [Sphingobacteriales bacterium]MBL0248382.1 orotidine-5'-phosphate decarboxylase [Sphingobacteriales bacterium]